MKRILVFIFMVLYVNILMNRLIYIELKIWYLILRLFFLEGYVFWNYINFWVFFWVCFIFSLLLVICYYDC